MVVRVERHAADYGDMDDGAIAYMHACTLESVHDWVSGAGGFEDAFSDALSEAGGLCSGDPSGGSAERAFRQAAEILSALFRGVAQGGGRVEVAVDDEVHTVLVDPGAGHATRWITAFWLSVVLRDEEMTDSLCAVSARRLREVAPEVDDFTVLWAEVLRNFWHQEKGYGELLVQAVRACGPDTVRFMDPRTALMCYYPQMDVFDKMLLGEAATFNGALQNALESFREHWTETPETAQDVRGMVAVELLGIACAAHDVGLPIEVESEYIPPALVTPAPASR